MANLVARADQGAVRYVGDTVLIDEYLDINWKSHPDREYEYYTVVVENMKGREHFVEVNMTNPSSSGTLAIEPVLFRSGQYRALLYGQKNYQELEDAGSYSDEESEREGGNELLDSYEFEVYGTEYGRGKAHSQKKIRKRVVRRYPPVGEYGQKAPDFIYVWHLILQINKKIITDQAFRSKGAAIKYATGVLNSVSSKESKTLAGKLGDINPQSAANSSASEGNFKADFNRLVLHLK